MNFIRFYNKAAEKFIGFQTAETKENIYKILLKSIVDFTIP